MFALVRSAIDRVKALFVAEAALDFEAQLIARNANRGQRALRQASEYERKGCLVSPKKCATLPTASAHGTAGLRAALHRPLASRSHDAPLPERRNGPKFRPRFPCPRPKKSSPHDLLAAPGPAPDRFRKRRRIRSRPAQGHPERGPRRTSRSPASKQHSRAVP